MIEPVAVNGGLWSRAIRGAQRYPFRAQKLDGSGWIGRNFDVRLILSDEMRSDAVGYYAYS